MRTRIEVSKLIGVPISQLRYYDKEGLLSPEREEHNELKYRVYSDEDLEKLWVILFLKELRFSIAEIRLFFSETDFDPIEKLGQQIEGLKKEKEHIERVIGFATMIHQTGLLPAPIEVISKMNFDEFIMQAETMYNTTISEEMINELHDVGISYELLEMVQSAVSKPGFTHTFADIIYEISVLMEKNYSVKTEEVQDQVKII